MMNEEFRTLDNNEGEMVVIPDEVALDVVTEETNSTNGVLIGAAIAGIGCLAYTMGPKIVKGVKGKLSRKSKETLEDKQARLLKELHEVNEKISNNDNVESE
ncbi:MAG: hypothetical protein ACRCTZ_09380 [Sarcina sp.]